ncbi:hypothetical protein KAK06_00835 [Ideonella sp. 4Y11]|uniref:Uncharacterized protein n=1 Tax=Ideonella aquatica TaxID=2824119 RepID=A0A940YQ98_9BURK|nr:hypothetical protein [Ideonella aquatica]MBQ0957490.1 hypothetical protein [Ideonella aquatica]
MATTLLQYWTDERTWLDAALLSLQADAAQAQAALQDARSRLAAASQALSQHTAADEAARRALAAIAMPGDSEPLLAAIEAARAGQARARAAAAQASQDAAAAQAESDRQGAWRGVLQAERDVAHRAVQRAQADQDTRQQAIDALLAGTLATDAAQALTDHESTARARIEGEFPSHGTAAKHFLKRVRARRALAVQSAALTASAEATARSASDSAVALAQRGLDSALAALGMAAGGGAAVLAAQSAALAQLAALPAADPGAGRYPVLTAAQRERLHDPARKSARETALAKLTAADDASAQWRDALQAYELAWHAAMVAQPGASRAALDSGLLAAERSALDAKALARDNAISAISAAEQATLETWFASVPDTLWAALERLDEALARLGALTTPAATLVAAVSSAEATLVSALETEVQAHRAARATRQAALHAAARLAAEQGGLPARASSLARSVAPV